MKELIKNKKFELTDHEASKLLEYFGAPFFMLANIKAGGDYTQANYDIKMTYENGSVVLTKGDSYN